jgi:hypothetical protein
MIDPLGNQTSRLGQRRLRMMNPIQGGACLERAQIIGSVPTQVPIRRHHRTLAPTRDLAEIVAHKQTPTCELLAITADKLD